MSGIKLYTSNNRGKFLSLQIRLYEGYNTQHKLVKLARVFCTAVKHIRNALGAAVLASDADHSSDDPAWFSVTCEWRGSTYVEYNAVATLCEYADVTTTSSSESYFEVRAALAARARELDALLRDRIHKTADAALKRAHASHAIDCCELTCAAHTLEYIFRTRCGLPVVDARAWVACTQSIDCRCTINHAFTHCVEASTRAMQ